jgi:hypothetical protein
MYQKFREYLLKISDLTLEQQKLKLEEEHLSWRGKEIQVDDIIVIGIKI